MLLDHLSLSKSIGMAPDRYYRLVTNANWTVSFRYLCFNLLITWKINYAFSNINESLLCV